MVATSLLLAACIPLHSEQIVTESSLTQKAAAANVKIFREGETPPASARQLGHIMGYACKSVATDPAATLGDATAEAKLNAMISGGNGITGFSCKLAGTNATCAECWNCSECSGMAVVVP
jgi:hypothetical protein